MPTYVKTDGREIEINELSEEYAKSLGWKPKTEEKPIEKPKTRKRASKKAK